MVESGDSAEVHAVFARQMPGTGVIDGLAWLGLGDLGNGYWRPPDILDELVAVSDLEVDLSWVDDRYYDVGTQVTVSQVSSERMDDWEDPDGFTDGRLLYYRDPGDVGAGQLGTLDSIGFSWPGGEDVPAETRPGAVQRVEAIELSSHDPAISHVWYEGTDLELVWNGAEEGEVWITVLGDLQWLQARLSGGPTFTIPADVLAEAVLDDVEVRVTRTALEEATAGPGTVLYRHAREQRLSFERSGPLWSTPSRIDLGTTVDLMVVYHTGVFVEGATTFDLGEGVTVDSVAIPGGEGPTAEVRVTVQTDAPTGDHDLVAVIEGETVLSERMVVVYLPPADTCEEAFTLPGPDTYHGELTGLNDDYSDPSACTGYLAEGPDSVYAVEIADDQVFSTTLSYPNADVVLYLAGGCEGMSQPLACSDVGGLNVAEFLSYAPLSGEGGTYYLVVDGYGELAEEAVDGYSLFVDWYTY